MPSTNALRVRQNYGAAAFAPDRLDFRALRHGGKEEQCPVKLQAAAGR
jgi:hypothetical protein